MWTARLAVLALIAVALPSLASADPDPVRDQDPIEQDREEIAEFERLLRVLDVAVAEKDRDVAHHIHGRLRGAMERELAQAETRVEGSDEPRSLARSGDDLQDPSADAEHRETAAGRYEWMVELLEGVGPLDHAGGWPSPSLVESRDLFDEFLTIMQSDLLAGAADSS